MSARDQRFEPRDAAVFEDNVARLVRHGHTPEAIDTGFEARLRAAVSRRVADNAAQAAPVVEAPVLAFRPRWGAALVAAAAALLLWWWSPWTATESSTGPGAVGSGESQPLVADDGQAPGNGEVDPRRAPESTDPGSLARGAEGGREPVAPDDSEAPADDLADAGSPAPGRSGLRAEVQWPAEAAAPFGEANALQARLIVLPQVSLPQVATPVDHDVELRSIDERRASLSAFDLEPGPARLFLQVPGMALCELADQRLEPDRVLDDLTFALRSPVAIRGRVVDAATGEPIAGAELLSEDDIALDVSPRGLDIPNAMDAPTGRSATDGSWTLEGLRGRTPLVRAEAPGYAPTWALADGEGPLELRLEPGARVFGQVLDQDGQPRQDSRVVVSRLADVAGRSLHYYGYSEVAADGSFAVDDLPPGFLVALLFDTSAASNDLPLAFRPIQLGGGAAGEVEFRADRLGRRLEGVVRDADGNPVENTTVYLVRQGVPITDDLRQTDPMAGDGPEWLATVTDDQGVFTLEDLNPGRFDVFVSNEGPQNMFWVREFEGPGEGAPLEVRLPLGKLEVSAEDGEGSPVGAVVVLFDAETDQFRGRALTFGGGPARLDPLHPGRYRADVFPFDTERAARRLEAFEVGSGEPTRLRTDFAAAAPWTLVVTDDEGRPFEGAELTVLDADGAVFQLNADVVLTDAQGTFTWEQAPEGAWLVRVEAPGCKPLETTVAGRVGQVQRFEVALEREP
ncbi:MAG: carboxypeptidase regulatory-like domain-containing protein [Planctomycetota bacterium]